MPVGDARYAERMRKFLTSGAMISSAFGFFSTMKKASGQRRRWRAILMWASWAITVAIAVAGVLDERDEEREKEIRRGHGRDRRR